MHIRSRIDKAQNATQKAPRRRGERIGNAEDLLEGSFPSLLIHKVSVFVTPQQWRKLPRLAALLCARCHGVIATTFQKWPARIFFLIAALLAVLVAGSRAWVGSENKGLSAPIREPVQVVRFTLYDVGIYPREAVVNKGLIAISIEDLSGGSEGLAVEHEKGPALECETGGAITQVRRERKHWRGRGEIKLTPGRYRVYDASRPANRATLIVEP
jgi:hypothetical protein